MCLHMGFLQDTDWGRTFHRYLSAYYDRVGFLFQGTRATRERYLAEVDLGPGDRVLDLGCGTGAVTAQIRERSETVHGVDISAAQVHRAATSRNVADVAFAVADATALPYTDRSFDAVVSVGLLPYVPTPAAAVREANRVTRPDGTCTFVVPKRPDNTAKRWLFEQVVETFTRAEMEDMLADCGYDGAETRTVHMDWLFRDAVVATGVA